MYVPSRAAARAIAYMKEAIAATSFNPTTDAR